MRQIPFPEDEADLDCEGATCFLDDSQAILIVTPEEPGSDSIDGEIGLIVKERCAVPMTMPTQYTWDEAMFIIPSHKVEEIITALRKAAEASE